MIILEEVETEFGNIRIVKSRKDGRYTYYQNGCTHSEADTEGISTCAYVHAMFSIIKQSQARKVLVIGCAGGTLATMLHRAGCDVTVVDINPYAFTLARRYFQMPEAISCVVQDGWAYLQDAPEQYDAIAIDAFNTEGDVSQQFILQDFFHHARSVLTPPGIVLMNVIVKHDFDLLADRIALNMEGAGIPAVLFDWSDGTDRNIIVAGGNDVRQLHINVDLNPPAIQHELRKVICRKARAPRSNKAV